MPRTLRKKAVARKNIRIPKPMTDEVEQLVLEHPELYNNRQQFIEAAIREKLERCYLIKQGVLESKPQGSRQRALPK